MMSNKNNIQELMMVNYCHPDCVPMLNIMRLPEEDASPVLRGAGQRLFEGLVCQWYRNQVAITGCGGPAVVGQVCEMSGGD